MEPILDSIVGLQGLLKPSFMSSPFVSQFILQVKNTSADKVFELLGFLRTEYFG